jgi:hypothetical protein
MARFVLLNTRTFAGGADLTSNENKIELAAEYEEKSTTNFGSGGWEECIAGLGSAKVTAEGQWEAGDSGKVDDNLWADLGGVGALTVCPESANAGELAYLTRALRGSYGLGDAVGEVAPWSANFASAWPIVRGFSLHPPGTARTADGTGTAVQHIAVPSGQYLYACLHVLSVSGTSTPTLTVKVQSDSANNFPSAADQITFTAATARGGEALRVAGPVTDTWYRASWTITGTNPSFLFVVSFGVAP